MSSWVLTICRILVGVLVIKTGADLVQGDHSVAGFSTHEPLLTGIFIILIGIHIIFSSIMNNDHE